jgi:hypothetical protein
VTTVPQPTYTSRPGPKAEVPAWRQDSRIHWQGVIDKNYFRSIAGVPPADPYQALCYQYWTWRPQSPYLQVEIVPIIEQLDPKIAGTPGGELQVRYHEAGALLKYSNDPDLCGPGPGPFPGVYFECLSQQRGDGVIDPTEKPPSERERWYPVRLSGGTANLDEGGPFLRPRYTCLTDGTWSIKGLFQITVERP